jgi:hypothetical protein
MSRNSWEKSHKIGFPCVASISDPENKTHFLKEELNFYLLFN